MSDEQSVIAALNSHDMWINPDDFDRAADEITCGGNEHMCEHARSDGGCYAEARGKYCPWIVAETLRAVGKCARAAQDAGTKQDSGTGAK